MGLIKVAWEKIEDMFELYMPVWEVVMLLVFFEMFMRFLMVCDVVCITGIPNSVNLS